MPDTVPVETMSPGEQPMGEWWLMISGIVTDMRGDDPRAVHLSAALRAPGLELVALRPA